MKPVPAIALILIAVALVTLSLSVFTVDEREQAIVLQLGQPVGDVQKPGLHFKIPFVQEVRRFDARILSVDPAPAQMVISSSRDNPLVAAASGSLAEAMEDQVTTPPAAIPEAKEPEAKDESDATTSDAIAPKAAPVATPAPTVAPTAAAPAPQQQRGEMVSGEPIIVDTFARYRISNPLMFMKTLRTIENANQRIENIMNDATRSVLGKSTMRELLSPERTNIMQEIRERANRKTVDDGLGIDIIDIRIVRADLTPELRQSTVTRMISELRERATETRAKGEERALEIRSTAEKERTVLLAESNRDAQVIQGDGDRLAIRTYADAYNKDKDFYAFTRSMEAYRNSFTDPNTRLILSPDSEFLKYFRRQAP